MKKELIERLAQLGAADKDQRELSEVEYISAIAALLKGQDFMRLGHGINGSRWEMVMMTVRRLKKNCNALGITCFDKGLDGIREAVRRRSVNDALQIMTRITAIRVRLINMINEGNEG